MRATTVTVTIDGLVVEGMTPAEARLLGAELERQLTVLILGRGVPAGLEAALELPELSLPDLDVGTKPRPESLGRSLADRLYAGLDRASPIGVDR